MRAWARQAEDGDRARLQHLQRELADDELKLKDKLANVAPMPKEKRRYLIKSARETVSLDKDAILKAQNSAKFCSDMIRTEIGVYAHNRDDPNHPEAQVSELRKSICGGQ